MLRFIALIIVAVIGLAIAVFANAYGLLMGMGIVLLATLIYAFTDKDEIDRGRWLFISFFVLLTALIAQFLLYLPLQAETLPATRLWALGIGAITSFVVTLIFFFLTIYMAGIQILLTHRDEGISIGDAIRSMTAVMLGTNQEWLVISEGKRARTNAKGLLKKLGGPGKVIIDPGNAVIFQRGGKISRIAGPGVVLTKKAEVIREIFDLRNQFVLKTVEDVITADQIPLTIVMGIPYRIERAKNPDAPGVLKDNKGGFPVEEKTLLTAIYENTAGKWSGLAAGAPTVQLRDQIMTRTLNDLFTHSGDPNPREIKAIEEAIKAAVDKFAGNKGVEILGADIREIHMPKEMEAAYTQSRAEERKNQAAADLLQQVLETVAQRADQSGHAELELAMAKSFIDVLKLSDASGTKFISVGTSPNIENTLSVEK